MKSRIKKIILLVIPIAVAVIFAAFYLKMLFEPISNDSREIDFLITKGSSVSQIGKKLEKEGIIRSAVAFKFYVQLTSSTSKIQAGEFQLSPNLTLMQIVDRLKKGPTEIWVTIPEGLRREEIALKFAEILEKDQSFIKEFLKLTQDKEGYLFPDTYLFPKNAAAESIVNKMISTFEKKNGDVAYKELIMASLLERETLSDEEKPIVAGVLYKRLSNNWPLQVDATLQYAKASVKCQASSAKCDYWEVPTSLDKEINSAFNTYKNTGLPPSPIANPGKTSIDAAKNPQESDYWFYIHDSQGRIHFAKTIEEHNVNIERYLR